MNVQPTNDLVDRIFERYTAPGSPGCAVAVVRDGEITYKQGYGLANLELKVPILPSTVFNIGSTAKQFTAFAIALLEDEGRLSLDDDMRRYLPEMHDLSETVTIRHLIHHTSGLRGSFPELLALAEWRDTDSTTTEDVFWLLKAQRELNYRPGDEYLYVNSNYVLLTLICERVSGQSFAAFCQERIFGPLGMTNSFINDSCTKLIPGRANGYYEDDQAGWMNAPLVDSVVGPTNVYTTVEDLARWDENFYTGHVGGLSVVERVHQPGRLNDGRELDYAFGLMVGPAHQHRGWQVVEHGGSQGGYGAWMVRFPELYLSVVVMFNLFLWAMRDYAIRVADLFLEDHPSQQRVPGTTATQQQAATAIELGAEQLEAKAGTYYDAQRGSLREVTCAEGQLQYQGLVLVPASETRFYFQDMPDTEVEFAPATEHAPARLKTITASGDYFYERVETVSPTQAELAQYAGRYYSPELDLTWTFVAGDGHLVAKRRKYVDSKLTPLFTDAFNDDWLPLMGYPTTYLVVFERDANGKVTGLRVTGTRVRNLSFVRQ
jgi:CubicO group peptidase (beta-lactamase class C family)